MLLSFLLHPSLSPPPLARYVSAQPRVGSANTCISGYGGHDADAVSWSSLWPRNMTRTRTTTPLRIRNVFSAPNPEVGSDLLIRSVCMYWNHLTTFRRLYTSFWAKMFTVEGHHPFLTSILLLCWWRYLLKLRPSIQLFPKRGYRRTLPSNINWTSTRVVV